MMLTSSRADWYDVYKDDCMMLAAIWWTVWCFHGYGQNDVPGRMMMNNWWDSMLMLIEEVLEISVGVMWQWWKFVETVSLNCKCKLVLQMRLGYLKPFLAGSKKTRQGPRCKVGALCISRCWFYLTVVARPKLIQKDYKIIWCCVLLCYGSWLF